MPTSLRPSEPRPLRLNLRCGAEWMRGGVVNIDRRNLLPPDGIEFLRGDSGDLSDMFAEGSAAEIWTREATLTEPMRLLAPGGVLHLQVPAASANEMRAILSGLGLQLGPEAQTARGLIWMQATK